MKYALLLSLLLSACSSIFGPPEWKCWDQPYVFQGTGGYLTVWIPTRMQEKNDDIPSYAKRCTAAQMKEKRATALRKDWL